MLRTCATFDRSDRAYGILPAVFGRFYGPSTCDAKNDINACISITGLKHASGPITCAQHEEYPILLAQTALP